MKKIFALLVVSVFLLSFMAVGVLAQNPNPNPNQGKNVCMKDAVKDKQASFIVLKAEYTLALSQAKLIEDEEDRKLAIKQARDNFKLGLKGVKASFKTARESCLA
ncbi:MAG: hypothetical protein Q8O84_00265 [Nanoarchaeota archaeon]|nr:hypothetical protein [Nanoarchaeota archaeon]